MIGKLYCSTGAFSRDPDLTDIDIIIEGTRQLACDGFELIYYPAFYDDPGTTTNLLWTIRDRLHVLHIEKSIGPLLGTGSAADAELALKRLATNAQLASDLEVERLVLHLWGLPDSDDDIDRNLSHYSECASIAESYGCRLTVESIPCRNETPLAHLRRVAAIHSDVAFTLDTEFLALHGELELAMSDGEILSRTEQIHLKDFGGSLVDEEGKRMYLHPGQRVIDFAALMDAINKVPKVIDLCLESTSVNESGFVDLKQVQLDLDFIMELSRSYVSRQS